MRDYYTEQAKKRMEAGKSPDGKAGGRGKKKENPPADLPEGLSGDARDQAGAARDQLLRARERIHPYDAPIFLVAHVRDDQMAVGLDRSLGSKQSPEEDKTVCAPAAGSMRRSFP